MLCLHKVTGVTLCNQRKNKKKSCVYINMSELLCNRFLYINQVYVDVHTKLSAL